jgi:protein SCO1/2
MVQSQRSAMARLRLVLWGLVVLVAIGAIAVYVIKPGRGHAELGLTGKPFALSATDGTTFTQASLKGTPTLLFFGYTFCPDVCTTTLAELAGYREQLKLAPNQLRIVFATVDPDRDTLKVMKEYLASFGTPVLGLTGTDAQVEAAKSAFGVYSKKIDEDGKGNYLVQHTATVFLLNSSGSFETQIDYGEDSASALAKIRKLAGA